MIKPEKLLLFKPVATQRLLFSPHAVQQMKLPDRDIRVDEVINAFQRVAGRCRARENAVFGVHERHGNLPRFAGAPASPDLGRGDFNGQNQLFRRREKSPNGYGPNDL